MLAGLSALLWGGTPVAPGQVVDLGLETPPESTSAATPEPPPQRAAPPQRPSLLLDRVSRFEPNEVVRNPFWPVGWRPGDAKAAPGPRMVTFTLPPETFRLTSTLPGWRPVAVINGRSYTVGESLHLLVGQDLVEVEIAAVEDGAVVVYIGQQLGAGGDWNRSQRNAYRISMKRRGLASGKAPLAEAVDLAAGEYPRAIPVYPIQPQVMRTGGLVDAATLMQRENAVEAEAPPEPDATAELAQDGVAPAATSPPAPSAE